MKCIFLIAMVAMIGLSAASLDVQIISPEDGTRIELGSKVVARIIMEVAGEENISTRLLVDGSPTKGLAWKPMAPGEYVLTIQAANNPDFVGAVSDFVVVTVYDDAPIRGATWIAPTAPPATPMTKLAPPGITKDRRDPDLAGSVPP